jgi:hypothetical protein
MTESQDEEGSLLDKILKETGIESVFHTGEFALNNDARPGGAVAHRRTRKMCS